MRGSCPPDRPGRRPATAPRAVERRPWRQIGDERLRARFREGASHEPLAAEFGRRPGAVVTRIERLGESVR